jgi:hypothetical protein
MLETVFVACSLMTFVNLRKGSLQESFIAGAFMASGATLLVWSFFLFKQRRSYAEIAWITLFLVVAVSLLFPKLH